MHSKRSKIAVYIKSNINSIIWVLEFLLWPGGSYELESVGPSVFLSGIFVRIGSLDFSETLKDVRGPYKDVHDSIYLERYPSGKNDQKWPKIVKNGTKMGFLDY